MSDTDIIGIGILSIIDILTSELICIETVILVDIHPFSKIFRNPVKSVVILDNATCINSGTFHIGIDKPSLILRHLRTHVNKSSVMVVIITRFRDDVTRIPTYKLKSAVFHLDINGTTYLFGEIEVQFLFGVFSVKIF